MIQAIQEKIDALIAANIPIIIQELSNEQAQQRGIKAPAGKSARIVTFEGFEPCGCGGAHTTRRQRNRTYRHKKNQIKERFYSYFLRNRTNQEIMVLEPIKATY